MALDTSFDPRHATLAEVLVHLHVVSRDQVNIALKKCEPDQKNLGQILVEMGYTTEERILKAVSVRMGIPYFTSFDGIIEKEAADYIPEIIARKSLAIPLFVSDGSLTVGMVNPLDLQTIDEIGARTKMRIQPVMTTLSNLFESIQYVYHSDAKTEDVPKKDEKKIIKNPNDEKSIVERVDYLLNEGLMRKASDIHIEAQEKKSLVRYRVDGILFDGDEFPKEEEAALVARIKILSRMDITETRLPQDGSLRFSYAGKKVDVRVSTLPTVYGEKVVLRLLDTSHSVRKISDLRLTPAIENAFIKAIQKPNGLVLVTGPTGSGKTTTLYAALKHVNDNTRNIVTLEDPVEYQINRLNQMEANERIGLTFATGLRSILRQDPDVILVGEIRDLETAHIAIQASITGHLVLSTLHTNDSISAVHRLINMGVEPFLLVASLGGVMAQRLVRRLCTQCRESYKMIPEEAELFGAAIDIDKPFYKPKGCETCFNSGYAGRFAVHEWLSITPKIKELVLKKESIDEIYKVAKADGFKTLQEDAMKKASQGLTSPAEVLRVTKEQVEG